MSSPYTYRPLDPSKREIRLIQITNLHETLFVTDTIEGDPELFNDPPRVRSIENNIPLRCTIEHISLDQEPAIHYAALSYTWGDPTYKQRLIVEGEEDGEREIQITSNLGAALRHIAVDASFWIDAICINQADDGEKSSQVRMMWQIYHNAHYVAAWLGPAADHSNLLIAQILDAEVAKAELLLRDATLATRDPVAYLQRAAAWRPQDDFIDVQAFAAFVRRPYWHRVWIQQELQASKNLWFWCGRRKLASDSVKFVFQTLTRLRNDGRLNRLGVVRYESFIGRVAALMADENTQAAQIAFSRHGTQVSPKLLYQILSSAYVYRRKLEASDPRDLIFALLGLSKDAQGLGVLPDYSKTVGQVFVDVAVALIEHTGLQCLHWANTNLALKKEAQTPSWVPDWRQQFLRPLSKLDAIITGQRSKIFRASQDTEEQFSLLELDDRPPALCVSGIVVDALKVVGPQMIETKVSDLNALFNDQDLDYSIQTAWLADIDALSEHCGRCYGNTHATKDAIWRTPIANLETTPQGKFMRAGDALRRGYEFYRGGLMRASIPAHEYYRRTEDLTLTANYVKMLVMWSSGRKYFVTEKGYLGLGPPTAKPGDDVVIVLGRDTLFVMSRNDDAFYSLLGEAYVHGLMEGEGLLSGNVEELVVS